MKLYPTTAKTFQYFSCHRKNIQNEKLKKATFIKYYTKKSYVASSYLNFDSLINQSKKNEIFSIEGFQGLPLNDRVSILSVKPLLETFKKEFLYKAFLKNVVKNYAEKLWFFWASRKKSKGCSSIFSKKKISGERQTTLTQKTSMRKPSQKENKPLTPSRRTERSPFLFSNNQMSIFLKNTVQTVFARNLSQVNEIDLLLIDLNLREFQIRIFENQQFYFKTNNLSFCKFLNNYNVQAYNFVSIFENIKSEFLWSICQSRDLQLQKKKVNELLDFKGQFLILREFLKKEILKCLLNPFNETQKSLTNESIYSTYDCVTSLTNQFKNQTKFILTTTLGILNFNGFTETSNQSNWLSLEFPCFFKKCFLFKKENTMNLAFSFLAKVSLNKINNNLLKNFSSLVKTFFFYLFEKYQLYYYYRKHTELLNLFTSSYRFQNVFLKFNNSLIYLTNSEKDLTDIVEKFKTIVKTRVSPFQILNSQVSHSSIPFLKLHKKIGIEIHNFYLIQKRVGSRFKNSSQSLLFEKRGLSGQENSLALMIWNKNMRKHAFSTGTSEFKRLVNSSQAKNLYTTQILPSYFTLIKYLTKLKILITKLKAQSQMVLIQKLKILINEWCNNFKILSNKKSFYFCDFILSRWVWRWACRRHSNKNRLWIQKKYYKFLPGEIQKLRSTPLALRDDIEASSEREKTRSVNFKNTKQRKWKFCFYNTSSNLFEVLPEHSQIKLMKHQKTPCLTSIYTKTWKSKINYSFFFRK